MTTQPTDTLKADLEAIQTIAEQQLGDWLGVSAVYQPADMHHWQEVHDAAFGAQETAYRLRKELDALKRQNETYRRLLHDIDQCAPAVIDTRELGLDLATALQTVRDEMESAS